MQILSVLFTLFVSGVVLAAPSKIPGRTTCSAATKTLVLPSSQPSGTPLATPSGSPSFVGVGVGVQNYTCSAAGTYTSAGAVAELFDISCLPESELNSITTLVWDAWEHAPKQITISEVISDLEQFSPPTVLGQHYFITNPVTGTGLSPKWDFTSASEAGHSDAFVVGAKTGDIPDPTTPSTNVDWLSLKNVAGEGDLATQIYRVQTHGGQPPSSCTPNSTLISVRYVAQYWLYGGSY